MANDWHPQGRKNTGPQDGGRKRGWQHQGVPASGPRKPWSKGSKLALAFTLLSVACGLAYLFVTFIQPPRPATLVLLGSSYDDNLALPHNAYGWRGLQELNKLADQAFFTSRGKLARAFEPQDVKSQAAWEKEMRRAVQEAREENVVVVLALHGAASRKGAFLYANDEKATERISLDQILTLLDAASLKSKKVVLVLEPALVQAHWSTGQLHNDFVRKLIEAKGKIEAMRNLVVFCASDVDQVSWPSEEWGPTIFSHFLHEGLLGAADGSVDQEGNSRVTAYELFKYVKDRVGSWSRANRGVEQTPILIGSEELAKSIELTQINTTYQERKPGDAPSQGFRPSPELESAWKAGQLLSNLVPHPAVYSPHLWRKYRDMLLRHEQLIRAGDPTGKAADLRQRLALLDETIRTQARFSPASALLSVGLPMPEVLGMPLAVTEAERSVDAELKKRLQALWDSLGEEKRPEILNDLAQVAKSMDKENPHLFRAHVYRVWMNFLARSAQVRDEHLLGKDSEKDESKSKVQALAELLETKIRDPRPAEVHFLTMLLQDASRTPPIPGDLLRKALETRLFAERSSLAVPEKEAIHPYSEAILPWIHEKVVKADAFRRPGEDYLIGSTEDAFAQSGKFLGEAVKQYQAIQDDVTIYRNALDTRDRLLADFAYYAHWASIQRPETKERETWTAALVQQITLVSGKLKELCATLQANAPNLKALDAQTKQLNTDFTNLRAILEGDAEQLAPQKDLQALWHLREAILAVPLLVEPAGENPVSLRMKLLVSNRETSAKLNGEVEQKVTKVAVEETGPKASERETDRQRKMAQASLKLFWPNEIAASETESTGQVEHTLGEVHGLWADKINNALHASLSEPDLKKAILTLREADHLARGIPGGHEVQLKSTPFSVPEGLRRLRLHDLFLAQARRTLMDHWYAEAQSPQITYFEPTALAYLKVAQALVEEGVESGDLKSLRQRDVVKLREQVRVVGLELDPNRTTYWTSEREFPISWHIKTPAEPYLWDPNAVKAPGTPPPGVVMVSRDLEGPAKWTDDPKKGLREPIELFTSERKVFPPPRPFALIKTDETGQRIKATYKALLRGQRLTTTTEVSPQPPEIIVHAFPPPAKSAIAVRMDPKFTYGAISIVLDLSGSMVWGGEFLINGRLRSDLAFEALETVFKRVPDNTYLSLQVFMTKQGKPNPEIVDVLSPTPWRRGKLKQIIDDLHDLRRRASDQTGPSPIAYAMADAYRRGFPPPSVNVRGPRVMLALTDGDDNWTGKTVGGNWPDPNNDAAGYARKIRQYLQEELATRDIEVHFVCFIDPDNAKDRAAVRRAEAQFKGVEDFTVPGQFTPLPNPGELALTLEKAIRPRLTLLQGATPPRGYPADGAFASLPDESEFNWIPVPAGQYAAQVKRSDISQLKLDPGDMISILLRRSERDGRKVEYEREMFAERAQDVSRILGEPKKHQGKTVAVLQNQLNTKYVQLQQLITIEESGGFARIQQSVPNFVWIESKPRLDGKMSRLRWFRQFGYPALAFRVIGESWPLKGTFPAPAEVKVWWTDYPEDRVYSMQLERSLKKKVPDTVRLGEQIATIEEMSLEEQEVVPDSHGPGRVGSRFVRKQCLVVRIEHSEGKPVMVQLTNTKHKGAEHHFFPSARKYTAMFWDLENPDQDRHAINVIFLDSLKREVEPATFNVQGHNTFPEPLPLRD